MTDGEVRGRRLLILGAALGIGLTAYGLLTSRAEAPSPEDAVAVVNGQPLSREAFDRFVTAVAKERRAAELSTEERERILDRLIDEELLLQHGIGLGLARHEPTARRVIVQSVIASVTASAEAFDPSEADLRDYHARNSDRFVRSGRVVVQAFSIPVVAGSEAEARALAAGVTEALRAGASPVRVVAEFPGVELPPLPGGPLPHETVRRYLGPTAALRSQDLPAGSTSEPFRTSRGYLVLRVVERRADAAPAFEDVAEAVRAEWTRSQGEEALARFLTDLREAAELDRIDPRTDSAGGEEPGRP